MQQLAIAVLTFFLLNLTTACTEQKGKATVKNTTESKTENQFILPSEIFGENRKCLLILPETYHDPSQNATTYPVIILLDGQTFLKTTEAAVHFLSSDSNRNHLMPESIIVAIENVDRERDFTITKIKTKRPNTMGGGQRFLDFIQKELLPYLDTNYRTQPSRTLIGHSLGGLLTLNAFMDPNSDFNGYISIDPSIWWDKEKMENKVDSILPTSFNKKIYIATANQGEANIGRNKKRHEDLYALLKDRMKNPKNVEQEYFEDEDHRSVPYIAIYHGLKFVNDSNP